jgi:hypothetical protein
LDEDWGLLMFGPLCGGELSSGGVWFKKMKKKKICTNCSQKLFLEINEIIF